MDVMKPTKIGLSVVLVAMLIVSATAAAQRASGPAPLPEQRKAAESAGFKITPAPDAWKAGEARPAWPADAVKAGAALFVRDYNLPLYPESRVGAKELTAPAVVNVALGEAEPLSLGVHALDDLKGLTVRARPTIAIHIRMKPPTVTVRCVEPAYIRGSGRGSKQAILTSLRVRPAEAIDLAKGTNRQYWIDVKVPADGKPGQWPFKIVVNSKGKAELTRSLTVNVRPYGLVSPKRFIGAFCATRIMPDKDTFTDWRNHGINGMLWFYSGLGWNPKLVDGKLKCDFGEVEALIDRYAAAGLDGPVTIALGNDRRGMLEMDLLRLYSRPEAEKKSVGGKTARVARMDDEVINTAYKECIRQFRDFLKTKKGWPELTLLHYDEPTERLMPEATLRYKQIKEVAPNIRVYGVTMNRLRWARMLAPISDILVCNGSYGSISRLGKETGDAVWGYSGATGVLGFGGARFNMGFRLYRYDIGAHWFWCYDFYPGGTPWNEFDSFTGDANWVVVYPGRTTQKHVPTLAWEGFREAWDDMRYAATVKKLLAGRDDAVAKAVGAEYQKLIKALPEGRDFTRAHGGEGDFYATLPGYHRLTDLRAKLAGMIDRLRRKQ